MGPPVQTPPCCRKRSVVGIMPSLQRRVRVVDLFNQILSLTALDGFHVISVVKTGGGKTTYFSGFMVALQELEKLPDSDDLKQCLCRPIPQNAISIIVYPTKGLEEEMAQTFNNLGIPSLAINEDTLKAARTERVDLWAQAIQPHLRCLLLSPEQLSSQSFTATLSNISFYSRIIALDVDEIHLILTWGAPGFRLSFRDIGNVLMRLPRWTTLTGVTATLPKDTDTNTIIQILGLKPGSSSACSDMASQGWAFPDFDWVIAGRRKTIIYCRTISLAFRLFVYLWHKDSPSNSIARRKRFRLYCSLYSNQYNKTSRDVFVNNPHCQVLISTDALKVGNDFPNIDDALVIDAEDPSDILQKGGRAGRRPPYSNPGPRCICYFTQSTMERAKTVVASGKDEDLNGCSGKMTVHMARLLTAKCIVRELDVQFDNPVDEVPCTCETCGKLPPPSSDTNCQCSGCKPEVSLPALPRQNAASRPGRGIVMANHLSKEMRKYGQHALKEFRYRIWEEAEEAEMEWFHPLGLLTDTSVNDILDEFLRLETIDDLLPYVNEFLHGHEHALLEEIQTLWKKFRRMNIGLDPDEIPVNENPRNNTQLVPTASYDTFFSSLQASDVSQPLQSRIVLRENPGAPRKASTNVVSTSSPGKRSLPPNAPSKSPAKRVKGNRLPVCYSLSILFRMPTF
ncbi:P-loop containing nucleoside triphosphate hydrolase protein [Lentinula raphanica]|nr:P-loop containing nucleoside triphosphate hydrolase protein [Lentinula raphanica]